nr:MAG: stage V sporulation protein AD [Bacillota bacterium]
MSQEVAAPGTRRLGRQSVAFSRPPVILGTGAVVGPMENQGPLAGSFDHAYPDLLAGQESFEQAEREMMLNACRTALQKAGVTPDQVDFFLSGDLLNQLITSSFAAAELGIPYLGIYGACATSAQGLALAAMLVDGGYARRVLVACSSHNGTAERQYRYPVEYGSQRKPYAQWTVTGAGAAVVASPDLGDGPRITHATLGKVMDLGIKDPYNQGAAMAPAAVDTIRQHLLDLGRRPEDYDLIATGDLARFGKEMATELLARDGGLDLGDRHVDCGMLIYDLDRQKVHAGGSGCACSAVVTYGHLLRRMAAGELRRLLLVATGALLSPTSCQQGESIPAVAHGVVIER